MRTPGRLGLMFASLLGAAVLLAAPPAVSPASAEIGTLAPRPPIVAQTDNARIDGSYVDWKLDNDGDIQLCWKTAKCYYFSNANANGTRSFCPSLSGGPGLNVLRNTLKASDPTQPVYAEFNDCYRGIPGGYYHGSLCITNNRTKEVQCGYVSELKNYRQDNP